MDRPQLALGHRARLLTLECGSGMIPPVWGILDEAEPRGTTAQAGRELRGGALTAVAGLPQALTSQPSAKPGHTGPSGPRTSTPQTPNFSTCEPSSAGCQNPSFWHLSLTGSQSLAGHRWSVRALLVGKADGAWPGFGRGAQPPTRGAGAPQPHSAAMGARERGGSQAGRCGLPPGNTSSK